MLGTFTPFGGGSKDISSLKATESYNDAQKKDAAKAAIRQWWLELQHQMEAENKKGAATTNGKPVLLSTTDSLQPLLDIVFFRYWDIDQVRTDGERLVQGEQTSRFVNDLMKDNEDVACAALKDYLKYKMYSAADENDTVKGKKTELAEAAKKAASCKFDLDTAIQICKKDANTAGDVEKALEAAKEAKADVASLEKDAEDCKALKEKKDNAEKELAAAVDAASSETVAQLDKACRAAKSCGSDTLAAEEKLDEMQVQKKLKGGEEDEKSKAHRAHNAEKNKAQKEKDDGKKAEDLDKLKKDREEQKIKLEEDTVKESEASFTGKWREACDAIVEDMATAYKKTPFTNRQAAEAKFRELIADSDKMSQNEMNKIFNLADGEKFNSVCTSLGFNPDAIEDAMKKLEPEQEEKAES